MPPPRPPPSSITTEDGRRLRVVTDADPSTPEDSSMKGAREHFINVLKGFIGSNYLSVPFAFSAAGMLLGPIAVCAVAAISGYGCLLLVGIRGRLLRRASLAPLNALETYPQVAGAVLGPWGYWLVEATLVLTQFGYCVGYLIYCTTAIRQLAPGLDRGVITFVLLTPPLILLCAIPDLRRFLPFSAISNLALLLAFLAIVGASLQHITTDHNPHYFHPSALRAGDATKLPLAFGNLVAAFEGIGTVLPIEHAMAEAGVRAAYPPLLRRALLLIAALFTLFGVVGYGAFGPGLCSVILTSLPPGAAADVARVAMVVGLFFTYGFQMYPVLELFDVRMRSNHDNSSSSAHILSPADAGRTPLLAPERDSDDPQSPNPFPMLQPPKGSGGGGGGGGYGALQSLPPADQQGSTGSSRGRNKLESWLLPPVGHYGRKWPWLYLGTRAGAVLLASLVAYLLPEFELLVALVGSLGASLLAFVVPGALALRCYPRASRGRRAGFVGLVLFGVVGGGIGAGYALRDLVRGKSQC